MRCGSDGILRDSAAEEFVISRNVSSLSFEIVTKSEQRCGIFQVAEFSRDKLSRPRVLGLAASSICCP
jgi:hypothetical protein